MGKTPKPTGTDPVFDAVVVGAGFSGMFALHKLRGLDLKVLVIEAGGSVGGKWYWNRYPGARCDVESLEYSYSFSEELQQEWRWPEKYSTQPEILRYAEHVAQRFDLKRDIRFNTRVLSASYDEDSGLWLLTTEKGDFITARYCVMASGNLSLPRVPDFKGLADFKGKWYHTGKWPHDSVDFTGMRVGVIGTGSSGMQAIPVIAKQATHLTVFQRTANYSVPAINGPISDEEDRERKAIYPQWRARQLRSPFGMAGHPPPPKGALDDNPEERQRNYETRWGYGGNIAFLCAYNDLLRNKESNETASEFVRQKIRAIVKDPAVAERLSPRDHFIGTKRLVVDSGYYDTFNRDNVSLVDVRSSPIECITATGIRTRDARYGLDAIVFATGYDAMTGALFGIDIRGKGKVLLSDKWKNGPRTYLGLMTAGFPNMFFITGPGSPSVKTNMVCHIEQHVHWIGDCIGWMRSAGRTRIDADCEREDKWVEHVNEVANSTLYPLASSWYTGANIPGKPRIFMPYVGGLDKYKAICDAVAQDEYRAFGLS